MADLLLNLTELERLKHDLNAVVSDFKDADDFSDDVADATGSDALHDPVRDFAHKWNDKRKKMTESIEALQAQIAGIADGFTSVDTGFAKGLQDSGMTTGPSAK
ncbi:MAG: hypothetical protein H7201_18960 [Candidatus Saccharibacteria bacterium]|nr:hypothetical protein [Microbacteriaceae bacterium]